MKKKKKKKKKNKNKNKNKKKRAPDPPGYLRPNSFVPRAPKGTHAGEGSLASEKVSLPIIVPYLAKTCYFLCGMPHLIKLRFTLISSANRTR